MTLQPRFTVWMRHSNKEEWRRFRTFPSMRMARICCTHWSNTDPTAIYIVCPEPADPNNLVKAS